MKYIHYDNQLSVPFVPKMSQAASREIYIKRMHRVSTRQIYGLLANDSTTMSPKYLIYLSIVALLLISYARESDGFFLALACLAGSSRCPLHRRTTTRATTSTVTSAATTESTVATSSVVTSTKQCDNVDDDLNCTD